jgi:perosamine synthetase
LAGLFKLKQLNRGIIKRFSRVADIFKQFTKPRYFGFVRGHSYLVDNQIESLYNLLLDQGNHTIRLEYESKFAGIVGSDPESSYSVSYAAGRMAFFAMMKLLAIGIGDEVILLGHTCSVMPNAILRTGATPIYADVDSRTFGSSAESIEKVISQRTKMIVAQHSFGIPCDINPIVELAKRKDIFLLEDCAITFGSTVNGVQVGNFGDAAIFSTDHSKPLNTMIGGVLFTRRLDIYLKLKKNQDSLPELPLSRQRAILETLIYERKYYHPRHYGKSALLSRLRKFKYAQEDTYLTDDYTHEFSENYPYPAKLPAFLAQLGMFELDRWHLEIGRRRAFLQHIIQAAETLELKEYLPKAYYDKSLEIVPLRFVYTHPSAHHIRARMSKHIDTNWLWFKKPIITCVDPRVFGYVYGSCPISEKIGTMIINWPCTFGKPDNIRLLKYFIKAHTK